MSLVLNAQQYVHTMEVGYSDAISIPMTSPPSEPGIYGIMCFDGMTGVATWDGSQWVDLDGVARYSGRPLLLPRERRAQLIEHIAEGINAPAQSALHAVASESALALARHYATKMEKNRAGPRVNEYILKMCACYLIARKIGVSFNPKETVTAASVTDKKLLTWSYGEIAQADRELIEGMLNGTARAGADLQSWVRDVLG